jgi:hypothetical protein
MSLSLKNPIALAKNIKKMNPIRAFKSLIIINYVILQGQTTLPITKVTSISILQMHLAIRYLFIIPTKVILFNQTLVRCSLVKLVAGRALDKKNRWLMRNATKKLRKGHRLGCFKLIKLILQL